MESSFAERFNNIIKKSSASPILSIPVTTNVDGESFSRLRAGSLALLRSLASRLEKTPEAELNLLANRLGDQSLSLAMAGKYLAKHARITVQQYIAEIDKTGAVFSQPLLDWVKDNPAPQAGDLAAVVIITLQSLDQDRFARRTFAAAGFCAAGIAIPFELIRKASGCDTKRQAALRQSLKKLYQLGLLKQLDREPVIHSQVKSIAILTALEPESILANLADALLELAQRELDQRELGKLNAEQQAAGCASSETIWAHTRLVAERAEPLGLKQTGKLWNSLGYHFYLAAEHQQAQECFERALAEEELVSDPEGLDLIPILNNLGRVRSDLKNFNGAKLCYERVLAIDEKAFTPDYPGVAADVNNLGQVLCSLGDLKGAKACFTRALSIHEKAYRYGPNHPAVANDLMNLGRILRYLGDLDGSVSCYERALEINESVHGFNHRVVADCSGQFGKALHARGDFAKARVCFEHQLAIEETTNGQEHTSIAATLNNLGLTLQDLGELHSARDCFERALKIDEQAFGPEDAIVARDLNNLGCVVRELGDLPWASVVFKRALAINEKCEETRWRDISTNANNLGRVLYSLDNLNGARDCFMRVHAIDTKVYGAESSEVATDLTNLGTVYLELNDLPAARSAYECALAILVKILPCTHQKVVTLQRYVNRLS
jgi:tetratricopeptide (TPR) repeat protein